MKRAAKTLSVFGVQPKSGASSFALLIGHYFSLQESSRCALIDIGASGANPPWFPAVSAPPRALHQLLPYADHLQDETIEHFFAAFESGLRYIPLIPHQHPEGPSRALEILAPFFDYLILDWGKASLPNMIPGQKAL
ncbi:MAG TPA: hypothetical protein VMU88_03700, partial [bacterium]|nr:hypothetical protein [bacterium]